MFKLRIADYINQNMLARDMTYKDLHTLSGVPDSSLHSYAQAKVNNPNEENLIRIAAAFGDPPDIIQQMRRESMESSAKENKLIAESDDQQRMEEFATLMRTNMAAILEEYRLQSAAQQTEIVQHADRRIEDERQRFEARVAEVMRQCDVEIAKTKEHAQEILRGEKEHRAELRSRNESTRAYLKSLVRNLTIALVVVSLFSAICIAAVGGYAFYAYHTFDREDPTRGLYRETPAPQAPEDFALEDDVK